MDKIIKNVVIIWATNNQEKYWYKILKHLEKLGYNIFPIHPQLSEIDTRCCVSDISEVRTDFELVVFVVNPEVTFNILSKNVSLFEWKKLWLQPWTYDDKIVTFCMNNFFDFEAKSCILKDFYWQ